MSIAQPRPSNAQQHSNTSKAIHESVEPPPQFGFRIDPHAYYIETEAAKLLKVSPHTLRRRRQKCSDLAYCKHGARVYYRGSDIIAALEASRRTSTSALPG